MDRISVRCEAKGVFPTASSSCRSTQGARNPKAGRVQKNTGKILTVHTPAPLLSTKSRSGVVAYSDRQQRQVFTNSAEVDDKSPVAEYDADLIPTTTENGSIGEENGLPVPPSSRPTSEATAEVNIQAESNTSRSHSVEANGKSDSEGSVETPPPPTPEPAPKAPDTPKEGELPAERTLNLDTFNPLKLGRNSRQLFDDVWQRVTQLGGVVQPTMYDVDEIVGGDMCEYENPLAQYTNVMVVGATGRVGRVLVRKLLLRGYSVSVLVRSASAAEQLPESKALTVVQADLNDEKAVRRALNGCNKIVFCAGGDLSDSQAITDVDNKGVRTLVKAFQDKESLKAKKRKGRSPQSKKMLVNFKDHVFDNWDCTFYNPMSQLVFSDNALGDTANLFPGTGEGNNKYGLFQGTLSNRNAHATIRGPMQKGRQTTALSNRFDTLQIRVLADGQQYSVRFHAFDEDGKERTYSARFETHRGWGTYRIPFSSFAQEVESNDDEDEEKVDLDPSTVRDISFRYSPRMKKDEAEAKQFRFEICYVKAEPIGEEPTFILVSCAGQRPGEDPAAISEMLAAKQIGEAVVRNSGLGYTIIRPGPLREEAGGQKALVFDQGGRVTQGISCADVADVCLKALHEGKARNKAFEVCYEYRSEEGSMYELVAHLPDKSNNYLAAAMQLLKRDTK
mmetsp:Transcript_42050/g.50971  ORF Transcript_42050/g.50971 Transcript_42050/m.50971 type:complete len:677 (-) Transcript_42050:497-2527(-)|eukprot:CAMPEP_0197846424 /NCGR_PEP_ID=MMETSP1438-20131217/3162_1 /TAXON_ID=1461541 /ORGANISM="Pterosperma sp., Strain CCMP1384" /LENGTH=676 /DNA_ID=CAMNT_0043458067 /DNA_START=79 /DNA_END=2109 /DNA_ORIENTATION=+